jgi:hypothetical protein
MVTDALVSALARMVEEAIRGDQRWIRWAIETGATPVKRCNCRVVIGEQGCVCSVELELPRAYMIRARHRLDRGEFVGLPPHKRRCLLCLRGEHDLDMTTRVTVVAHDGRVINEYRTPVAAHRSKRKDRLRADKAGAHLAGTRESQVAAAREYEKERWRRESAP